MTEAASFLTIYSMSYRLLGYRALSKMPIVAQMVSWVVEHESHSSPFKGIQNQLWVDGRAKGTWNMWYHESTDVNLLCKNQKYSFLPTNGFTLKPTSKNQNQTKTPTTGPCHACFSSGTRKTSYDHCMVSLVVSFILESQFLFWRHLPAIQSKASISICCAITCFP